MQPLGKIAFMAALAVGLATPANAQLAIDRLWVDFSPSATPRSDLVVRNESKDVYYVTVSVDEIIAPGTVEEKRVRGTDPEQMGLLVTPNRLVLRPNDMRAIRLVSLNNALDRDRVYRVSVVPQVGELSLQKNEASDKAIAIKVLAAFDVLVTARPAKPAQQLVSTHDGKWMNIANQGNSNILLLDGEVCPPKDGALSAETKAEFLRMEIEQQQAQQAAATAKAGDTAMPVASPAPTETALRADGCKVIGARRMYAQNNWRIPAAKGETVRFLQRRSAGEDGRIVEFQ